MFSQSDPVMLKEFDKLKDQEVELILKAPLLVCILVAGADGNIDRKEINEAVSFVRKQKKSQSFLKNYFKELNQDFEDKLKILIQSYPYESTQRNPLIIEELSGLNALWPKVDREFAKALYEVLKAVAEKIASSSGGLLGYRSIGSEEAKFLQLSMITDPSN